jgi:hypothetical protein
VTSRVTRGNLSPGSLAGRRRRWKKKVGYRSDQLCYRAIAYVSLSFLLSCSFCVELGSWIGIYTMILHRTKPLNENKNSGSFSYVLMNNEEYLN